MPDFVGKIITNPLVLIGVLLTMITLDEADYKNSLQFFLEWRTYRNLIIGAIIYVAIFDRKYTKGRKRIAVLDNIRAVFGSAFVIFISWVMTIGLIVQFQVRGERIGEKIRERYMGQTYNRGIEEEGIDISHAIKDINFQVGRSYIITIYSKDAISVDEYGAEPKNSLMQGLDKNTIQTFIEMIKMRKE